MTFNLKKWDKILQLQVVVTFVVGIYFLILPNQISAKTTTNPVLTWASWIDLLLVIVLHFFRNKRKQMEILYHIFAFLLPFSLLYFYKILFYRLASCLSPISQVVAIIGLIGYVLSYIPMAVAEYGNLQNPLARVIGIEFVLESILANSYRPGVSNSFFNDFIQSGIFNSCLMLIFSYLVLTFWGLKFDLNAKFKKSSNLQWWVLIFLIIFAVWYPFYYSFISIAQTPMNAIWNFDFSLLDPTQSSSFDSAWRVIFTAIEAGTFEELFRYTMVMALLVGLSKARFRIQWTVLISGVIFGVGHIINYFNGSIKVLEQSLIQVTVTSVFGMFAAILFLYTSKVWAPMLLHFVTDFLFFSHTSLADGMPNFLSGYSYSAWGIALLTIAVPLVVIIFMLTGKRLKFMQENAARLVSR